VGLYTELFYAIIPTLKTLWFEWLKTVMHGQITNITLQVGEKGML